MLRVVLSDLSIRLAHGAKTTIHGISIALLTQRPGHMFFSGPQGHTKGSNSSLSEHEEQYGQQSLGIRPIRPAIARQTAC